VVIPSDIHKSSTRYHRSAI